MATLPKDTGKPQATSGLESLYLFAIRKSLPNDATQFGEAVFDATDLIITGPATIYEEDGITVHSTIADGAKGALPLRFREVTDNINGDCSFKRMVPCSLLYKYT